MNNNAEVLAKIDAQVATLQVEAEHEADAIARAFSSMADKIRKGRDCGEISVSNYNAICARINALYRLKSDFSK